MIAQLLFLGTSLVNHHKYRTTTKTVREVSSYFFFFVKAIWRGDDQAYNSKGLINGIQTAQEKSQLGHHASPIVPSVHTDPVLSNA